MTDAPTRELIQLGLLDDEMTLSPATKNIAGTKYTATSTGGGSFNFGYGHIRFILFLEWRICAELMLDQKVKLDV